MLKRLIDWSVANVLIVLIATIAVVGAGLWALRRTPLEALPDLSDVQVIVQTDFNEQAPRIVEDQVTYPIAAEMLKVPGAMTVRGYSFFGVSFVYVIFADGTDLYWARSRVLEYLNGITSRLPSGLTPRLGPDATGLGWVYQYALEDTTGRLDLAQLRSLQDWTLRYALTSVPGVAEVASIGGFEKQYQVDVDPARLQAYGIPITRVTGAVQNANSDAGAMVMELSEREYMVRSLGYFRSINDIENVVVGATGRGTPIRIVDVGRVHVGPAVRRGVAELDGRGDAVGAIVVMRFGANALATINGIKAKLAEVEKGLPPGVVVRPVYDRSDLINRAIENLRSKLLEESLIVALVCLVFLVHARSALVAIVTLPVGILMAFVGMRALGVGADIMSLGGIAIAIGAMIDGAIVMIENMHKHLERAEGASAGPETGARIDSSVLTPADRWRIVSESAKQVGPALFFSLLIITVSFLPVFTLEGQEGRLFKPLAYTKTLAMASASLLSITVVPVAMGLFIRGRIVREQANPINRALIAVYRPVIRWVLAHRWGVVSGAVIALVLTWIPYQRSGSEFMPPLGEGTMLYMPSTLPGISVARVRELLREQDSLLKQFPEVEHVWGKAGRATTATDPAGLDMIETTISLKPESEWPAGMTYDRLVADMDRAVAMPGVRNAWTMPIKGRIDMLATGIRTPVGAKIFGPDLRELERLGKQVEDAVQMVPGTRSAFAERAVSGYYLDIQIDRGAAARHGLNVGDIESVIAAAVGGMPVTETVEGRERYAVRIRYPEDLRDTPERLATVLIPMSHGGGAAEATAGGMAMGDAQAATTAQRYVPLGQVATIREVAGPMVVRTEGAVPTAWVYIDVTGTDIGSYVTNAKRAVEAAVKFPPGYSLSWSGQYEYMERARARMAIVVPATLLIIFLLLYLNFRNVPETLLVMLSLPFALVGGVWLTWLLGYNWSVAVAIGFIALAGVAAETGVVMLIYLDDAWRARHADGRVPTAGDLYEAIMEGAADRVRPRMMTTAAIMAGLFPILVGHGVGSSVMQRIAAPMVGGMTSSTVLTLIVIPAVYSLWKERTIAAAHASHGAPVYPGPARPTQVPRPAAGRG
jgi:Cu(I)/Ag(I) efflux system membrane protein CusA/SilA